jgi:hypothetical protein
LSIGGKLKFEISVRDHARLINYTSKIIYQRGSFHQGNEEIDPEENQKMKN